MGYAGHSVLAAIIANLQNVRPAPTPPGPTVIKSDRGGGGPSWPGYDLVDIVGALNSFREIPGEHPVARAARRHQHIGLHLQGAKEAREQREAAAFLAGAALASQVAQARIGETEAELARVVALYDSVTAELAAARAAAATAAAIAAAPRGRGAYEGGDSLGGIGALLITGVAGIAIGLAISRSRRR